MSSISVKWQSANAAKSKYAQQRRELSDAIASVRSVKSYRCMSGRNFSGVYNALGKVITRLENEKSYIQNLETGITEILKAYQDCERKLVGDIISGDAEQKDNILISGLKWFWNNALIKTSPIGALVKLIGDGVTAVKNLVTGQWEQWIIDGQGSKVLKDIVSCLKSGNTAAGGIAGIIGNVLREAEKNNLTVTWKDFFKKDNWWGGNNVIGDMVEIVDGNAVKGNFWGKFQESFAKQFDFSLPEGATTADKVKLGTKWAGYALTLISNGIDNYEEYKDGQISGGRAVAETAIETGVDIAISAAATAAVSAAAVALGATAAPAIAVGIGAAAVTWAANGVCKWITGGKDIGEVVADAICDHPIRTLVSNPATAPIGIGILATKWLGILK